ncbi:ATP-binding protein [Hydrogenovibrio kuenenii]|uniref:ATP-binding protein n=1 Tax=Hydrogenovibrio kuenenii TaxID=63658 RepID=UPI0004B086FC|nr:ATP-binding protein [Hydrogenovibrio kuenenii]
MSKKIRWDKHFAAIWRAKKEKFKPVEALDPIRLSNLLGIERQKNLFCQNLQSFMAGQPANHVLLWGARGTGKSSLMKAALNEFHADGLRVIELEKEDISDLPEISDKLRKQPWRFVVYCDDLSFAADDNSYRHLKILMEGSIEPPADNILMVATSNRRHLVAEHYQDNLESETRSNGEIHLGDRLQEKLSLADRFGLSLSFYAPDQVLYLEMVEALFKEHQMTLSSSELEQLHLEAVRFATSRGSRSGRIAKQFFQDYLVRNSFI